MDAPAPGGLGGTFGGNPAACAAANAILESLPELLPRAREIGAVVSARLERIAPAGSEVRGLGPMLALELPEQSPDRAAATLAAARDRGPAAPDLRPLRQRHPPARPVRHLRRRSRTRPRDPGERRLAPAASDVEVGGARKTYGDVVAVADVDLAVGAGTFFTLLGPSGSGKTTTLRLIAGFERPDAGRIRLGGEDITDLPAVRARRQHRLPGLRALPAHDRRRERRLRAARQGRRRGPSAAGRSTRC